MKVTDPLHIPQVLKNRYFMQSKIGQGNYGTVFSALDRIKNCTVAVKTINTARPDQQQIRTFVKLEIQILEDLRHPHIVQLLDHFEINSIIYLIYELCDGGDLFAMIRKKGRIPEHEALLIIEELSQAFIALNHKNIIHRDLKPENVFFLNGKAKLGDFGLSVIGKFVTENQQVGSLAFQAPEIYSKMEYSPKTDIYSCGLMLYEMLTGILPFGDDSPEVIFNIKMNLKVNIPSSLKLSSGLVNLIEKMIKPIPEQRIDFLEVLKIVRQLIKNKKIEVSRRIQRVDRSNNDKYMRYHSTRDQSKRFELYRVAKPVNKLKLPHLGFKVTPDTIFTPKIIKTSQKIFVENKQSNKNMDMNLKTQISKTDKKSKFKTTFQSSITSQHGNSQTSLIKNKFVSINDDFFDSPKIQASKLKNYSLSNLSRHPQLYRNNKLVTKHKTINKTFEKSAKKISQKQNQNDYSILKSLTGNNFTMACESFGQKYNQSNSLYYTSNSNKISNQIPDEINNKSQVKDHLRRITQDKSMKSPKIRILEESIIIDENKYQKNDNSLFNKKAIKVESPIYGKKMNHRNLNQTQISLNTSNSKIVNKSTNILSTTKERQKNYIHPQKIRFEQPYSLLQTADILDAKIINTIKKDKRTSKLEKSFEKQGRQVEHKLNFSAYFKRIGMKSDINNHQKVLSENKSKNIFRKVTNSRATATTEESVREKERNTESPMLINRKLGRRVIVAKDIHPQ